MQIVVAGQGYVGLPLAVRAAQAGHHVVGYDVDPDRIRRLTAGDSYVEDVPSSLLRAVLDTGAYAATADAAALAGFDLAVITVPTPLRDGVPDLSHIEACAQTLGEHLRPGATVVLESTTYPAPPRNCWCRPWRRPRASKADRTSASDSVPSGSPPAARDGPSRGRRK